MSFVVTRAKSLAAAAVPAAFANRSQMYQGVSAQAAAGVHEVFTTTLAIGAGSYADTEAANAISAR
jgi:PE family